MLTVISFGVLVLICGHIKKAGNIRYSTGAIMIMFFEGLMSLLSFLILLGLGIFYVEDMSSSLANRDSTKPSAFTIRLVMIIISG